MHFGQPVCQVFRIRRAQFLLRVQPAELPEEKHCLHLRHPVVPCVFLPTTREDGVLLPASFAEKTVHNVPHVPVVGDYHAPFARRHELGLLETETAELSQRARELPLVPRTVGLGAVFDDDQVVLLCYPIDSIHVAEIAADMDRDDGPCSGREGFRNPIGIQAVVVRAYIDEDRFRTHHQGGQVGRHPGGWGCEDLVAGPDPGISQGHFQRHGTVGNGEGIVHPKVGTDRFPERIHLAARGVADVSPVAGVDHRRRRLRLGLGKYRPTRKGSRPHRFGAVDC